VSALHGKKRGIFNNESDIKHLLHSTVLLSQAKKYECQKCAYHHDSIFNKNDIAALKAHKPDNF